MAQEKFFNLQHSESVIAHMASRIFSAFVQANSVNDDNEDQLIKKSAHIAIKMAGYVDRLVKSDEEWMKGEKITKPISL